MPEQDEIKIYTESGGYALLQGRQFIERAIKDLEAVGHVIVRITEGGKCITHQIRE